ncbi:MAG: outer membrane protein transport protein [Nitrospiraceae bacterium]|nr:outer membrane protein transport protein [Nitrospiraceae bacterium]
MHIRSRSVLAVLSLLLCSVLVAPAAFATDGMNLEGYGPIATGMGGASMAYDNGTAAMMNNPATLSLMQSNNRLDAALGYLGPHITASAPGAPDADSSSTAFFMPAIGWVQKNKELSYGVGVFAQGGMGAEYSADSFLANPAGPGYPTGDKVRSELGVGRFLIPVSYEINKDLAVGGSLDFVWATLDLQMALPGMEFLNMAGFTPTPSQFGTVTGDMLTSFGTLVANGVVNPTNPVNWGRFDFTDGSDFTGKAKGTGFAGKIGTVYKVNKQLSLGATYHSKTALGDLEANGATVSFNANVDNNVLAGGAPTGAGYTPVTIPVMGKIKVKDFQWPQMIGFGAAYQATDKLLLAADYKWINWAGVMKSFKMSFTADGYQYDPMAAAFANTTIDATLFQKWKDQHVFMLGAAYKFTDQFTGRIGANIANNPIPDQFLNYLFPATIKSHYTLGAGYDINKTNTVNASFTYAPEVKSDAGSGVTIKHYQTNAQVMYSYLF